MTASALARIDGVVIVALVWLLIGLCGIFSHRHFVLVSRRLFPISAIISLALTVLAVASIAGETQQLILPIGLPGLPFHLRLDALSSFFLALLGAASAVLPPLGFSLGATAILILVAAWEAISLRPKEA